VCATDHQCRTTCKPDTQATDCAGGQTCSSGACYEPAELALLNAPEAGGPDAGAEPDACVVKTPSAPLGYRPSNFDPTALVFDGGTVDWSKVPDVSITANCNQSVGVSCLPVPAVTVTLKDGTSADLYAVGSFTVASNVTLLLRGPRVEIIAAARDVDIQGTITAAADPGSSGPGGYPNTSLNEGPGAGGNGFVGAFPTSAAGGGSYCGTGGTGSGTGTIARGGSVYGTPELVPLVAGSAGGFWAGNSFAGYSGGGFQISTGGALTIRNVGALSAGGAGNFGGGGAGGAILLEGTTILVQGIVTANGGAGGTDSVRGSNASPNDTAAAGGTTTGQGPGGAGSGGDQINGGNGTFPDGGLMPSYGAGGGGAGRIRFNTACGGATVEATAIISPHLTTACATQGKLTSSP
jgi:hypothetical protein